MTAWGGEEQKNCSSFGVAPGELTPSAERRSLSLALELAAVMNRPILAEVVQTSLSG